MALTLLEMVSRAGQGEDGGASRVDVESSWSTRLKPSVATTSDFAVRKEKTVKGVEVDYFEDLIVREDGVWGVRTPNAGEEKLVATLKTKLGNVGAFSMKDFAALVMPALESAIGNRGGDEEAMDGEKAADRSLRDGEQTDEELLFLRLLRKGGPHVGRKLLAAIVNCCLGLQFWNGLKVLIDCRLVTSASHPDLVEKLVEHRKANLLCMCFHYVLDLTPSDIMTALRYLLDKSNASKGDFEAVRQDWRKVGSAAVGAIAKFREYQMKREEAIARELVEKRRAARERLFLRDPLAILPAEEENFPNELERGKLDELLPINRTSVSHAVVMALAVDSFEGWETCLHVLVASAQDEAVLAAILAELDTSEAVKLLQYLRKWLDHYSNRLSGNPSPIRNAKRPIHSVPSSHQVLQWVNMVLDGQYTKCVLSSEFLPELRAIQKSVESVVAIGRKLVPLLGVTEHIRAMHPLPARRRDGAANSDYTIEYLDIS